MTSVNQRLRIEIGNFPEFDNDIELIGSREMELVSYQLLTTPIPKANGSLMKQLIAREKKYSQNSLESLLKDNELKAHINNINLEYYDPIRKETLHAGTVKFLSYFVFDIEKIVR